MLGTILSKRHQYLKGHNYNTAAPTPKEEQHNELITKEGFVTHKRKDQVTVDVGDDKKLIFSLEVITAPFIPKLFDRITLICEIQQDVNRFSEDGPVLTVKKIKNPSLINITGKITSIEEEIRGVIDEQYFFNWDALADDYTDVNVGDIVEGECIECEAVNDSVFAWRCLSVKLKQSKNSFDEANSLPINKNTANKNGVEITENVFVDFNKKNETKEFKMMVKNTSTNDFKVLKSVFVGSQCDTQLTLISPFSRALFILKAGEVKEYKFKATSEKFGEARELFRITFSGESTGTFHIGRYIKVSVYDTERSHPTIGTGSNVHRNYGYTHSVHTTVHSNIISGSPSNSKNNFVYVKFDDWSIPDIFPNIVFNPASSRCSINDALLIRVPHLFDNLNIDNYSQIFHDLLYLEECEMEHGIRKYDKTSYFTREKELLALAMENVAESRPSIVVGDFVYARSVGVCDKKVTRRGFIHEVKKNSILLNFDEAFHENYANEYYEINFKFSRKSLKKQHHAIELATKRLLSILFPTEIVMKGKQVDVSLNLKNGELHSSDSILRWFNPSLNIVQKQAVTNILQGVARPLPYVIFGPPGTGKTVTLIETILQIIKNIPSSRILVATPSNSSANLITQSIIESGALKPDEFIRLVSHNHVHSDSIPKNIIRYCGTIDIARDRTEEDKYEVIESGLRKKCNAKRLKSHRMLIGTCVTLGSLMQCDFPEDYFTHVIIDESGQCLETELIIPMSFVDKDIGQVILAGDPKQLGPIVLSYFAPKLKKSFLVRLLEQGPYKPDAKHLEHRYDPRLVTRLVCNYRSLPSIMAVYSERFYDNDLKAMVNDVNSDDAKILSELRPILPTDRKITQGVIFIGVKGRNEKGEESPSWFNVEEADSVSRFYKKLVHMGHKVDKIGIISPYMQQVKKIRKTLTNANLPIPKVGTVEEFQGQERKIILLSTVRTAEHHLNLDDRHSLGFIKSSERMNVAISRARALLVIFGSPKLLSTDPNWKFLIEYCVKNKSYLE